MTREDSEQFLEYVLTITGQMMECGAEARRAEDTALRLVEAYGFELRCAIAISSKVEVSVKDSDGHHFTQQVRVHSISTDMGKLERLNAMARKICREKPAVRKIGELIQEEQKNTYSPWLVFAGYLSMTAGFAVFFGGDVLDGVASALVSIIIFCTDRLLNHKLRASQNKLFYTFLASFLAGCLALVLVKLGLGHHADKVMIGDVMLFIPGLSFVNGVRELFYRDIITGFYRVVEAIILALAIASGFGVAILLLGGVLA